MSDFQGVEFGEDQILEPGWYDAELTSFSDVIKGRMGPFIFWRFTPDGYDVELGIITSIPENGSPPGRNMKGTELARRVVGKSDATDQAWGNDITDRRPRVGWGPALIGKRATIQVSKTWDDDAEEFTNRVENVVTLGAVEAVNRDPDAPF